MLVIGAGVTLIEALKAADALAKENINIRVLDPFTLKPLDKESIIKHAKAVGGKILTVEDHYVEGNVYLDWSYVNQRHYLTKLFDFYSLIQGALVRLWLLLWQERLG